MNKVIEKLLPLGSKIVIVAFVLIFPLIAGKFCNEPLTWPIYGITAVYSVIFLFHICWSYKSVFPTARSLIRLLLPAFFFGAAVLSTAVSNQAILLTIFMTFGFGLSLSGKREDKSSVSLGGRARLLWIVDLAFVLLVGGDAVALGLAHGDSAIALAFAFACAALLIGLAAFFLASKISKVPYLSVRLICWGISILAMTIPAILSCFSSDLPSGFRYFLIPLFATPLWVTLLILDALWASKGKGTSDHFARPSFVCVPYGRLWQYICVCISLLFLNAGALATAVFSQATYASPYVAPFLFLYGALFLLATLPIVLLYPTISSANPLRGFVFGFAIFLFLATYTLISMFCIPQDEAEWEIVRTSIFPLSMMFFPISWFFFYLVMRMMDANVALEPPNQIGQSLGFLFATFAFMSLIGLYSNTYPVGPLPVRIVLVSLSALSFALSQGIRAWNERSLLPRTACLILYVFCLALCFLDVDPLLRLILSMPSLLIWLFSSPPFFIGRIPPVTSLEYRPII